MANELYASGRMPGMVSPNAYIMAGKEALGADLKALAKMEEQLARGVKPSAVHKETGWYKGKDDQPRFEIPDLESRLIVDPKNAASHGYKDFIGNVFEHPEFFKNYPVMKDMLVEFRDDLGKNVSGQIGSGHIALSSLISPEQQRLTLLHELQHAVQNFEKFAPGSTGSEKSLKDYKRSYGEAEARMVEHRADDLYSQLEKDFPGGATYFKKATGVPFESTIVNNPVDILGFYRSQKEPKPQPKPEVPADIRTQLEEFKRKAAHNEQLRHEYLKEYHQAELADIPPYEEWLKQTGKQKLAEGGDVKKPFTSPKHSGYNIDHMRYELSRQG